MRCRRIVRFPYNPPLDLLIPSLTLPPLRPRRLDIVNTLKTVNTIPKHIDHSAFPHIIDAVFEYADRETLLALRCVSRTFRTTADALLAAHLVCGWASVETPTGRHPALANIHARVCELPADAAVRGAPVPWVSSSALSSPSHTPQTPPASTSSPAVVDFRDMFTPRSISLLPAHTGTLRVWLSSFMHNPAITTSSDTVIVFGWPRTPAIGPVYEPWVALRPTTRRVVYHISTRYRAHSELLAQLRSSDGGIEELTVIVTAVDPKPKAWECAPLLHFLRCVVAAARRCPRMRVSVVNAAALPKLFPSEGSIVFGDDGVAPFVRTFNEYVIRMMGDEEESKTIEQWHFVGLDEHRRHVGDRQFALEIG